MTTQAPSQIRFARYNGTLLGAGPFVWSQSRGIESGIIFEVDADGLPKLQAYINGDERQRASFTVMEPDYVETLRRCTACHVYFPTEMQEKRHLHYHTRLAEHSPELARLARLDLLDEQDRQAVRDAEQRIVARSAERQELQAKVAALGLVASIADGH